MDTPDGDRPMRVVRASVPRHCPEGTWVLSDYRIDPDNLDIRDVVVACSCGRRYDVILVNRWIDPPISIEALVEEGLWHDEI